MMLFLAGIVTGWITLPAFIGIWLFCSNLKYEKDRRKWMLTEDYQNWLKEKEEYYAREGW